MYLHISIFTHCGVEEDCIKFQLRVCPKINGFVLKTSQFYLCIFKLRCSVIGIFIIFYVVLHCVLQIQLETSYQTCQRKEVRPRSLRSCVPLTLCQIERTFIKDGNGNPRIPGMLEKMTCQSMMTGAVGKVERRGQTKGNLVMVKENLCKGLNLLKVIFGVQHVADVK